MTALRGIPDAQPRLSTWLLILVVTLGLGASAEELGGGLTADELAAEAPGGSALSTGSDAPANVPVPAADAGDVRIEVNSEYGYVDEQGRYVVDLLEQDYAYVTVTLETPDGRPVVGASVDLALAGASRLVRPDELSDQTTTDEIGLVEFAVVGGQMGLDQVDVTFGDSKAVVLFNVISLRAAGFPPLPEVEGGLSWGELMSARVRYENMAIVADFPKAITERAGDVVRVSGFMMPLDPSLKQHRFLLTSSPPSCFFHVPGGPSGAIEVLSEAGIEASWDPVVVEGRFEPQSKSKLGVVYRVLDATLVTQ